MYTPLPDSLMLWIPPAIWMSEGHQLPKSSGVFPTCVDTLHTDKLLMIAWLLHLLTVNRGRLTCSLEWAPLCVCSSSLFPLIHSVSRGSCPHGNLYRILTPWDAGSSSSSSATSLLLKSDGDSANWEDFNPLVLVEIKLCWCRSKLKTHWLCQSMAARWTVWDQTSATNILWQKRFRHSLSSTTWVSVLSSDPATGKKCEESRTTPRMFEWPQQGF